MQLQVGDRFTDEEGVWEVAEHRFATPQGKLVHAMIRKPGDSASVRERTWPAYERLTVERVPVISAPKGSAMPKRSGGRHEKGQT